MIAANVADSAPVRWQIVVSATAQRALQRLPEKAATAIVEFVTGPLTDDPLRLSKPLRNELEGWRTARRGHYRVTIRVDESQGTVLVGRIEHRSTVYLPR